MKHAIYGLLIVLGIGSSVVLAEDKISAVEETPNKSLVAKTLTATTSSEGKTTKPLTGEFSVSQPDVGTGLIQVTLGLFVVLLIIAAAAWFTRRFGYFQSTVGGNMRIIGGLHLGTRERLVVVQVGEEQLLLGVAPGRVSTLHVLAKPLNQDDVLSNRSQQSSGAFLDKLNAVLKRQRV